MPGHEFEVRPPVQWRLQLTDDVTLSDLVARINDLDLRFTVVDDGSPKDTLFRRFGPAAVYFKRIE